MTEDEATRHLWLNVIVQALVDLCRPLTAKTEGSVREQERAKYEAQHFFADQDLAELYCDLAGVDVGYLYRKMADFKNDPSEIDAFFERFSQKPPVRKGRNKKRYRHHA